MDFYSRQAGARSQTRWLIIAFTIAVLLIVLALDFVLFTAFGMAESGRNLSALELVARKPGLAFFCTVLALSGETQDSGSGRYYETRDGSWVQRFGLTWI